MARILCIDDSKFSRSRVTTPLKAAGHEILEAADGVEGFEQFETCSPDLIVSDLLMPNRDGIEQLRMIRATGSKVPVIIASADIQESTRQTCEELGIQGFLQKPFKPEVLLELVSAALQDSEVSV